MLKKGRGAASVGETTTRGAHGRVDAVCETEPSLATLAVVLRRVDLDALAVTMVEAYRDQIEAYSRLPRRLLYGRKLEVARANLDLFARLAEEQRSITEADIDGPRNAALFDVHDGIPLEGVLQAYQIGGALAWRTIADAARPEEHATGLLAATHLYVSFSERVAAAVCEVYAEELERCDAAANRAELAAFEALVGGQSGGETLARLAEAAKLRLAATYTPFVARTGGDSDLELARSLSSAGVFVVHDAGAVAGFLQAPADERVLERCDAAFAIAREIPREGLQTALASLHQLVEVAARAGLRGGIEEREFLLERCLLSAPALDDALARLVVAPLAGHDAAHGSQLLNTLRYFVDSGLRRKVAAQMLHIHPNTLDCRLARITSLTGLDLARPRDLAQAIVAVSRAAIGGDHAPS